MRGKVGYTALIFKTIFRPYLTQKYRMDLYGGKLTVSTLCNLPVANALSNLFVKEFLESLM